MVLEFYFSDLKNIKIKADFFLDLIVFCKLFKQKIKTKTIAAGSFRNNCVKLNLKNLNQSYMCHWQPGSHLRTTLLKDQI